MKTTLIAVVALMSLSICAFAASQQVSSADQGGQAEPIYFGLQMVGACGSKHLTFDCSLSRELAKAIDVKKI